MNTNKTLADARPGGRVRLGDQSELDRLEFQAWAEQLKHTLTRWGNGPGDVMPLFVSEVAGNYISPATQAAWEAWRHLSAQPSPGVQDALATARELLAAEFDKNEVTAAAARRLRNHNETAVEAAALRVIAARQPSKQPDSVALGEATEFCIEKGDQQPVGEPVAWLIERLRGKGYGRDKYVVMKGQASSDPDSDLFWTDQQARDNHRVTPLYKWPAQSVDLGQFRPAVECWRWTTAAAVNSRTLDTEMERSALVDVNEADRLLALIDSQAVGK